MSEYGVGREEAGAAEEPVPAGGFAVEPVELAEPPEPLDPLADPVDDPEPVEEYADPQYADPQKWISGLVAALDRAEQGIGSGPRDALMARIKLAQAYSELGDTVQAAPLAVANVAQARRLFPSSEGMLRQLREFRDAACEAAGWTAAMMRESDEDGEDLDGFGADGPGGLGGLGGFEKPSELVARPDSAANADPAEDFAAVRETMAPAHAHAAPAEDFAAEHESSGHEMSARANQPAEPESVGAVIHEFVRRPQEPDALQWAAEVQAALTQPAELALPAPAEPEYAEEVESALASTDLADLGDLSDLADLAAIEEIIRLRYELREAQRTVERLRHVNRKLREALEYDETP